MARAVAILGLLVGIAGLAIQFSVTIPASLAAGWTFAGALVFFFTFFTILTNMLVVAVYASRVIGSTRGLGGWLASARVAGGTAVAIAVVGIVYATVLAQLWQPQGLFKVADVTLHYVAPALYLIWWLAFGRDGATSWRDLPLWLAYPLAYLVVGMSRGFATGEFPYPFLNPAANGWIGVAQASLAILALFLAVSAVILFADRKLPRR
jgi:hypothetical protein